MSRHFAPPALTPEETQQLRGSGLKEFPETHKSFRCPRCGFGFFNVFEDCLRCQKCTFWTKIEAPDKKKLSEVQLKFDPHAVKIAKDQAVECAYCERNLFRLWSTRLECAYDHRGVEFEPALKFYWPMAIVMPWKPKGGGSKKPSPGTAKHMSRSSIYRDIKKQHK